MHHITGHSSIFGIHHQLFWSWYRYSGIGYSHVSHVRVPGIVIHKFCSTENLKTLRCLLQLGLPKFGPLLPSLLAPWKRWLNQQPPKARNTLRLEVLDFSGSAVFPTISVSERRQNLTFAFHLFHTIKTSFQVLSSKWRVTCQGQLQIQNVTNLCYSDAVDNAKQVLWVLCLWCSPAKQSFLRNPGDSLHSVTPKLPACSSTEGDLNLWRAHTVYLPNMLHQLDPHSLLSDAQMDWKKTMFEQFESNLMPSHSALTFSRSSHEKSTHLQLKPFLWETLGNSFKEVPRSVPVHNVLGATRPLPSSSSSAS